MMRTPIAPAKKRVWDDLVGTVIAGRYVVESVLGQGGMGTVFQALHTDLDRPVAIKVLNPQQAAKTSSVQRFHNEARSSGAIGHPNICEVYDLGTLPSGSPFLVMEYITGETLAARVGREKGLPVLDAIDILGGVLAGLSAAHAKSIVHRDIKPENIMLITTPRPGVKILDFDDAPTQVYRPDAPPPGLPPLPPMAPRMPSRPGELGSARPPRPPPLPSQVRTTMAPRATPSGAPPRPAPEPFPSRPPQPPPDQTEKMTRDQFPPKPERKRKP